MAVADLDPDFWQFGMTLFAFGAVSPWLSLVDHDKYGRYIDTVQNLDITTIAGCHTPVLEGDLIPRAFSHTRSFPTDAAAAAEPVDPGPDHRRHRPAGGLSPRPGRPVVSCRCRWCRRPQPSR